jgi:phage antirepressor YoqD-like protein
MKTRNGEINVQDMCRKLQLSADDARKWLRAEKLRWHRHGERWQVAKGSSQEADMWRVLKRAGTTRF